MRAQEALRIASLPPVPEGLTPEKARALIDKSTDILLEQTTTAARTVMKELGMKTPEELRARVRFLAVILW